MEEEKNPVLEEIEKEIEETKARNTGEFEIEIADEPPETEQKEKVEKAPEPEKAPTAEYGAKVQRRIRTLIKEKKTSKHSMTKLNKHYILQLRKVILRHKLNLVNN